MAMVALDAPRTKVVPTGSLEARWMVNEGDVSEYIKAAKKAPKMQDLMKAEAKQRQDDEDEAKKTAALEAGARTARLKQLGAI